jgi:hypothetical protein
VFSWFVKGGLARATSALGIYQRRYGEESMKTSTLRFTALATALTSSANIFSTLSIALVLVACANEALAFDENWHYSWGSEGYNYTDIGTSKNRTCFLSGVAGTIERVATSSGGFASQVHVGLEIRTQPLLGEAHYWLGVQPPGGGKLNAWARCVNTPGGRTEEQIWCSNSPTAVELGVVTEKRRCFLTGIFSSSEPYRQNAFTTDADYVKVWRDLPDDPTPTKKWWLGGKTQGYACAKARCIDVTGDLGWWETGPVEPGPWEGKMINSPPSEFASGNTCFLQGIKGRFIYENYSDGAYIHYSSGENAFKITTMHSKIAWVQCVK